MDKKVTLAQLKEVVQEAYDQVKTNTGGKRKAEKADVSFIASRWTGFMNWFSGLKNKGMLS